MYDCALHKTQVKFYFFTLLLINNDESFAPQQRSNSSAILKTTRYKKWRICWHSAGYTISKV